MNFMYEEKFILGKLVAFITYIYCFLYFFEMNIIANSKSYRTDIYTTFQIDSCCNLLSDFRWTLIGVISWISLYLSINTYEISRINTLVKELPKETRSNSLENF